MRRGDETVARDHGGRQLRGSAPRSTIDRVCVSTTFHNISLLPLDIYHTKRTDSVLEKAPSSQRSQRRPARIVSRTDWILCARLRRGSRRPHLPPAARSARRKSKPRVPAKVKGGREWSSKHDAQACGESWQAAGACAVRVGAARHWNGSAFSPGHAGPPNRERANCDGARCSGAHRRASAASRVV